MSLEFWFRVLGVIFLAFAAFGVPSVWRIHWGWLGLFLLYAITLP